MVEGYMFQVPIYGHHFLLHNWLCLFQWAIYIPSYGHQIIGKMRLSSIGIGRFPLAKRGNTLLQRLLSRGCFVLSTLRRSHVQIIDVIYGTYIIIYIF